MKVLWKQGVAVVGIIIISPLGFETNFKQSKTKTKQTNKQSVKKKIISVFMSLLRQSDK